MKSFEPVLLSVPLKDEISIENVSATGKNISFNISTKKDISDVIALVAVYDENGENLENVKIIDASATKNADNSKSCEFDVMLQGKRIVVMLWKNAGNIEPLTKAAECIDS